MKTVGRCAVLTSVDLFTFECKWGLQWHRHSVCLCRWTAVRPSRHARMLLAYIHIPAPRRWTITMELCNHISTHHLRHCLGHCSDWQTIM